MLLRLPLTPAPGTRYTEQAGAEHQQRSRFRNWCRGGIELVDHVPPQSHTTTISQPGVASLIEQRRRDSAAIVRKRHDWTVRGQACEEHAAGRSQGKDVTIIIPVLMPICI